MTPRPSQQQAGLARQSLFDSCDSGQDRKTEAGLACTEASARVSSCPPLVVASEAPAALSSTWLPALRSSHLDLHRIALVASSPHFLLTTILKPADSKRYARSEGQFTGCWRLPWAGRSSFRELSSPAPTQMTLSSRPIHFSVFGQAITLPSS
eukprot:163893-Hanusia_phi.AAC.3